MKMTRFIANLIAIGGLGCTEYKVQPTEDSGDDMLVLFTCENDLVLDQEITVDESCLKVENLATLDFTIEWKLNYFSNFPNFAEILMAPAVGQLTDDDGDGDIDSDDIPDIVTIADDGGNHFSVQGILRVVSGLGEEMMVLEKLIDGNLQIYPYRFSNVALGDVNADGLPEIVLIAYQMEGGDDDYEEDVIEDVHVGRSNQTDTPPDIPCNVAAFSPDGQMLWIATELELQCGGHAPYLADLEGDGSVEVIIGSAIIEGSDGSLRAGMSNFSGVYLSYPEIGMHSVVADLNVDGTQEIVAGPSLIDHQGVEICSNSDLPDGFNATADFNGDGIGEFVNVGNGIISILDLECRIVNSWPVAGSGNGGPPTIADFDTDRQLEIGVADALTYTVYRMDGSILWSHEVDDESSHATGSVVFDFDNDGRPEVVYADETRLWVLGGKDGAVRLEDTRHASRTLHEYPTIADVDGDGSSEIIVPNGGGHLGEHKRGLYVLGPSTGEWAMSRQVWNQYAYSITNVNDDLSIPATPEPNWYQYNNYRNADPQPQPSWYLPDLYPIGELCPQDCEGGNIDLVASIANRGLQKSTQPVQLIVYTDRNSPTIIASKTLEQGIESGQSSPPVSFDLDSTSIVEEEIWLELYSSDLNECNTENNKTYLATNLCP